MARRGGKRKQLPIRSLLERLAELERRMADPNLAHARVRYRRRRKTGQSFLLSLGATCVAGGVALGAAVLANGKVTYRPTQLSTANAHTAAAPAADRHAAPTIETLLARDEARGIRQLWWKVPR